MASDALSAPAGVSDAPSRSRAPRTRGSWADRLFSPLPWLLAVVTFPLLLSGGLVTSYDVGMSVTDWPTSMGQNMFTFPMFEYAAGVIMEHSHRLFGAGAGLIAIALSATSLASSRPSWQKWVAVGLLLGVCVQGTLGGIRVRANAPYGREIALVHGWTGQMLFACMVAFASTVSGRRESERPVFVEAHSLKMFSAAMVGILSLQAALGGAVRHLGQAFPLHWLTGSALLLLSLYITTLALLNPSLHRVMRGTSLTLSLLLVAQVSLGIAAMTLTGVLPPGYGQTPSHREAMVTTAHQALAALIMAFAVINLRRSLLVTTEAAEARAGTTSASTLVGEGARA